MTRDPQACGTRPRIFALVESHGSPSWFQRSTLARCGGSFRQPFRSLEKLPEHPSFTSLVVERWAWALFLQRRHLLPQSDVLQHQVGAVPTHRPNGTDAK